MMSDQLAASVHRLHPIWIVYSAINSLRALIFPLVIMLFSGGNAFQWFGIGTGLLITVAIVGYRALMWNRFTYEISARGIHVRSGVISRQERFLPSERIQTIDLNEDVLHRLLQIVAIKVESAAGSVAGADIVLEAVSRADAARIRHDLLSLKATGISANDVSPAVQETTREEEGELLGTIPMRRLVVAGATSGRVGPALGLIFAGLQFSDELLPLRFWDQIIDKTPDPTVEIIGALLLIGALLAWSFAIISTFLTYGNFELRRIDNRLQATYGLLERRRVSIPITRIQAISVTEGILRQPFGLATIRAESAGYGKESAESGILMPLLPLAEVNAFLQRACPEFAIDPTTIPLNGPPVRARLRYLTAPIWGALVLIVIAILLGIVVGPLSTNWAVAAIPVIGIAGIMGWMNYRDSGWYIGPSGLLVIRGRSIDRNTTITRGRRIQQCTLTENPFQRRAGLASFHAAVASGGAGGRISVAHLDKVDAVSLLHASARP